MEFGEESDSMAFISGVFVLIILIFASLFCIGVIGCWIVGIIFAVNRKKGIRNIFFCLAGIGTAIILGVGIWIYVGVEYEKVETREGTARISSDTVYGFQEALEDDDVQEVKKYLSEEPALREYTFDWVGVNYYGYAIMNDSYEVVKYLLENGQEVDDIVDSEQKEGGTDNAIHLYCGQKNTYWDLEDMTNEESESFNLEMIHLLIEYGSDLSKSDEWEEERPLLQDYLMLCCGDGSFSDEEFQILKELEEAGMQMKVEFDDGKDALTYFRDMAAMLEMNKNQPERYEQICREISVDGGEESDSKDQHNEK